MVIKTATPNSDLNLFVREFYYQSFDKNISDNSGIVADDGCYELLFVKENNISLECAELKTSQLPNSFTFHKILPPFRFKFPEKLSVFGVKLQPWANTAVIPNNLMRGVVDLKNIYNSSIEIFRERLFQQDDFNSMIKMASSFLFFHKINLDTEILLVKDICEEIYRSNGAISVQNLSDRFNVNRQKLNSIFKFHVKYRLKYFMKLIRMRAIIEFKMKSPEVTFTQASHQFGYFDQAHFINDFKKICGTTPSLFIKNRSFSFNYLR